MENLILLYKKGITNLITTIKNVILDGKNIGYLAITENANDIKSSY